MGSIHRISDLHLGFDSPERELRALASHRSQQRLTDRLRISVDGQDYSREGLPTCVVDAEHQEDQRHPRPRQLPKPPIAQPVQVNRGQDGVELPGMDTVEELVGREAALRDNDRTAMDQS